MGWFSKIFGRDNQSAETSTDIANTPSFDTTDAQSEKSQSSQPMLPQSPLPITVESERYDQQNAGAFVELLCEGYRLNGDFTLTEIADFVRAKRDEHPDHVLFATLDNVWQAAYTSGHSTDVNVLDETEGHDLSGLPSEVFEECEGVMEHLGYLTHPKEFPIRHKNFMTKVAEHITSDFSYGLFWLTDTETKTIMNPDDVKTYIREQTSFVQIVPVASAPEALAAYPNGYFSDDLDPFENYSLAQYIEDSFGYRLFGVGASYLGFMREDVPDEETTLRLADFLAGITESYEGTERLVDVIVTKLANVREFYLAYGAR